MDRPFEPLVTLSRVAVAALAAVILTDLYAIWADVQEIELLSRVNTGQRTTFEELQESDDRMRVVALAVLVAFLAAAVAFLAWFVRAYRNLPALGASGLRYR